MTTITIDDAYEKGWVAAARWAKRDDLFADIGSTAYMNDRDAALAAQPSGPAWHDAPTAPGLWVCQREDRHKSYRVADPLVWVTAPEIGDRWCGPLPEDTK
jgi:hypothetical protein